MTSDLHGAVEAQGVADIMDVTLVPYGNAQVVGGKVQCQHGQDECEGNRWEQCAISHYPKFSDHYPFYYCMEKTGESAGSFSTKHVKSCASQAKLDYDTLNTCFSGPESNKLQKKFGDLTPKDHKYTPWVLINGKLLGETTPFLSAVCEAYEGAKPAGCLALSLRKKRSFNNATIV